VPTERFGDLDRPPLSAAALTRSLVVEGSLWRQIRVVEEAGSTNADVAEATADGAAPGLVIVAESQVAGRGRLDRAWETPPRAGLTFSVLLQPAVPAATWGWLPLMAGVAVVEGVRRATQLPVTLKWPNDVLAADGRKIGGILCERVEAPGGPYAVVGIGLNVTTKEAELPVPTATSLAIAGADAPDRSTVLKAVLRCLATQFSAWQDGDGDAVKSGLTDEYRASLDTLGRRVHVLLPGGRTLDGEAVDIDGEGRLMVGTDGGLVALAAGDVVHVR
jgi:BirA family biotin operon repressor/biotin-[acetyl-CoA-carboxylase] ligase